MALNKILAVSTALLMAAIGIASVATAAPVRIESGLIDGVEAGGISIYKGIPFAAPPLGDLRWRPPAAPPHWSGVRHATSFAPACMQDQHMNAVWGLPVLPTSEDCLYLNVWTPAQKSGERLPVMVWIYGGGFAMGGTAFPSYDGVSLARKGVVMVSIAYRVGAFGFLADPALSAESGHGSGEYGLLDQIAALRWVRRNIARFGGDPNRVTIFGESAGGFSVAMLSQSPLAKNLFQRAISESGGAMAPAKRDDEGGQQTPLLSEAEHNGAQFLAVLGAHSIAEARKLPAEKFLTGPGIVMGGFWPNIDGYVLPGDPYIAYQQRRYNDIPILVGINSDEGAMFIPTTSVADFTASVRKGYGPYADRILAAYPAGNDAEALRSSRDLFSDTGFGWNSWTWARLQTETGKSKAFVYFFNHPPPPRVPSQPRDPGAIHGSELGYVFGTLPPNADAGDRAMSDAIETYWVNFARTGNPNGKGALPWPAFDNAQRSVMRFDRTPDAGTLTNLARLILLDKYYAWRRDQLKNVPGYFGRQETSAADCACGGGHSP